MWPWWVLNSGRVPQFTDISIKFAQSGNHAPISSCTSGFLFEAAHFLRAFKLVQMKLTT